MSENYSPLRYPGGKGKIAILVKEIVRSNQLLDCTYVEPFAGGAAVGLSLLFSGYVSRVILNDINPQLYSFWKSILDDPSYIVDRTKKCDLSVDEWRKQKEIFRNFSKYSQDEVGFSFFYLNRTNRSGILGAGVIGGLSQNGKYRVGARFYRNELVARIERIHDYRSRIEFRNEDTIDLLRSFQTRPSQKYFAYFDPPYYCKGQNLYTNFYAHGDHEALSSYIQENLAIKWIVTYDNTEEIHKLYSQRRIRTFNLRYCANDVRMAEEILIISDNLIEPDEAGKNEPSFLLTNIST